MGIEFTDNSAQVKAVLSDGVKAFLYESGGELQSQTMRNSRVDTGQTRGSYQYKVSEGATESAVHIGSNFQNAIWEEYGTGEYALHGDGRKGAESFDGTVANRGGEFGDGTGKAECGA